jgi:hypothetical protein
MNAEYRQPVRSTNQVRDGWADKSEAAILPNN